MARAKLCRMLQAVVVAVGVVAWACLVFIGIKIFLDYKTTTGAQGAAPPNWPTASSLSPAPGLSTLIMFIHPKCPCSRASLSELNIIMNGERESESAFIVFLRPGGVEADWANTDTWETAGRIPHATRFIDRNGTEANRFGALTSGYVVLYDRNGHLQFSGGITDSRGHAGNNVGRQAVLQLLASRSTNEHRHPVFGCPMDSQSESAKNSGRPSP